LKITLPDGMQREFPRGTTAGEVAAAIGRRLAADAVAAEVDGRAVDLALPLDHDASLRILTFKDAEGREIYRHGASHVMAQAVKRLFPEARLAIGPAIEDGFYYDFDLPRALTEEDLPRIEAEMAKVVGEKLPFTREEMPKDKALALFGGMGETYKAEMIKEIADPTVSVYRQGEFVDLCRGPHIPDAGRLGAFKLLSVAGAYWRGDEKNKMLQRIYGTAYPDKKDLDEHLRVIEEAKKRDHRKLGRELDLFSIQEEAGPGFVIWHPKGALMRMLLEDFEKKEHLRRGYHLVVGPQILKLDLWMKSGHYENYRENMYFTEIDEVKYGIKPMNCLSHILIYKSHIRSYRDLPLRYFELGTVYRHERAGVLHGLLRVRGFTQDDAHLFCAPEQLNAEIRGVIAFVRDVMAVFGFSYHMEISTRPEKSIGSAESWETATSALRRALDDEGIPYVINEGDGAFYGPKIDVKLRDAIGRTWQCATVQCDFALPERFDLEYAGADGARHRPVMLHRVILGSIDRFLGVLIEHYAGAFPPWLAPVQAKVLTISDKSANHAKFLAGKLQGAGVRVECDLRNEKIGYKIREGRLEKIPYLLVVGEREAEAGTVAVRHREKGEMGSMTVEGFLEMVRGEIAPPTLPVIERS
jgi:threonyl-tRNA synthetase